MAERKPIKVKEREFIVECINLYRKLPALWNVKSKEYHDRNKKNIAYKILLSKYKEMFPEASKDDVKKKFNTLRTNYRKELKKLLESKKSASSTDDITYQPRLWYYNKMFFLQDRLDEGCTPQKIIEKEKPMKGKERQFIVECINLYRKLPPLWNVKSKEYHDRDKKNAAYKVLLSKYKEMFPEATKDDVKKKINSLRTNYRKELKKLLQSKKTGSSKGDIYQPTLWYFNEMFFLQDQESASDSQFSKETRSTIHSVEGKIESFTRDNNDRQESTTTIGDEQVQSTSNAVPKTQDKNLKRKYDKKLMELQAKRLRRKPDEYENWALACAADLKKMEPIQQIFAKNAIATIIMEGQLGLLHRDSVKINAPTPTHSNSSPIPTYYNTKPSPRYLINYSQQQSDDSNESTVQHNYKLQLNE